MKTQQTKQLIFDKAWSLMQGHKEGNETNGIYTDETQRAFTFVDEENIITEEQAKELIMKAIDEELTKNNKVYLYTCPDNALIQIEDGQALLKEDPEAASYYEEEIPGTLFIGYD